MHFLLLALAVEVLAPGNAFVEPFAVARDRAGNVYVCEHKGERITRIDRQGRVSRFAGTGTAGFGGDGGPAQEASFTDPHGIVLSPDDRWMYVADTQNHRVRRIDMRSGIITTVAGTGERGFGGDGGAAVAARFDGAFGIALDAAGRNLYVADLGNRRVRRINLASGVIDTVAGNGKKSAPADGAMAVSAPLQDPRAVATDRAGNVYVLERSGNALRMVDGTGHIRTLIAPGSGKPDLNGPKHLWVDRDGSVIIADAENNLVRRFRDGVLTTVDAGPLKRPHGVYVDRSGVLFICDSYNGRVLRVK